MDYLEMLRKKKLRCPCLHAPSFVSGDDCQSFGDNINVGSKEKPICINESELENIKSATKNQMRNWRLFPNRYLLPTGNCVSCSQRKSPFPQPPKWSGGAMKPITNLLPGGQVGDGRRGRDDQSGHSYLGFVAVVLRDAGENQRRDREHQLERNH